MISFRCDRCDRTIEVPGEMAGAKMECPDCGDMNIVPRASPSASAAGGSAAGSDPAAAGAAASARAASHRDAALREAGLPPATGPERTVLTVHPAMFRAIPGLFLLLWLFVLGGLIGGAVFAFRAGGEPVYMWLCFTLAGAGAVWLFVWWVRCHHATLKITNKRTIRDLGLLSKNTSEVSHDTIRNFQVHQTFLGRLLNVGSIGISSAGQDEVEITIDHVAKPMELRRIIDLYRHE